jgi:ClpP class serine protease
LIQEKSMLPHLTARLFGTPLLIHQPKLEVILSVLGPRLGLPERVGQGGYLQPERTQPEQPSGIAVIPIHGTLVRRTLGLEADSGLTSYQSIQQMLETARDDNAVAAILLDIDSPGGESNGVFDLADKIRSIGLQKPVWAVANDMAFSAAYALASAAQKVFISRTGGVGSIGVSLQPIHLPTGSSSVHSLYFGRGNEDGECACVATTCGGLAGKWADASGVLPAAGA